MSHNRPARGGLQLSRAAGLFLSDAVKKWAGLPDQFKPLVAKAQALHPTNEGAIDPATVEILWKEQHSAFATAQEIARLRFRLPEYSVLVDLQASQVKYPIDSAGVPATLLLPSSIATRRISESSSLLSSPFSHA